MIDLEQFAAQLTALEAEAKAAGLPKAMRAVIWDMQSKVLPNILKKREQTK